MNRLSKTDTRSEILATAKNHLRRFGEERMTVVEIARVLGMSHGNVYRFFKNKTAILDAIVDEWLQEIGAFLQSIAGRPGSAAERLEQLVIELHRRKVRKLTEDAEFYATFRRLVQQRSSVVAAYRKMRHETIVRILREGVVRRELRAIDLPVAATAFEDAMTLFLNPAMIAMHLQEDIDARVRAVVKILFQGLTRLSGKKSTENSTNGCPLAPGFCSTKDREESGRISLPKSPAFCAENPKI